MAVSLKDIKTKIASTKNTSQITNAMQMVSAAKLGRSEEAARNFQVYAQKVRKLLTDILHGNGSGGSTNPMLISRPVKKTGYIVITSDRGLVGGYNASIRKSYFRHTVATTALESHHGSFPTQRSSYTLHPLHLDPSQQSEAFVPHAFDL